MANILVLGAGELGTPILHHLIAGRKPGTSISLVVRPSTLADPESSQSSLAKYLVANDVTRIGADINRATTEELATLFRSHDTVVSASGMTAPPGTQLKLAHAVLEAGVSRYVPWQFGLDYDAIGKGGAQDLFDEQLDVRALLRAQKRTEWAIISTGIFMTFLFEDAFGVVEGLRASVQPTVKALGDWDNKVTYTHPEDIGRVLDAWPEVRNEIVFVAGDTICFGELAREVSYATGAIIHTELWDIAHLESDLRASPDDGMRKYRVVLAKGTGVAWEKQTSWNAIKGIQMKTVKDFVRELYHALNSAGICN